MFNFSDVFFQSSLIAHVSLHMFINRLYAEFIGI